MKFAIGEERVPGSSEPRRFVWDSAAVINAHMLVVGASGTGKTYNLRRIMDHLSRGRDTRIYVIDVHGDISIPGASTVRFSETQPYGLNPLLIRNDPDFGGVRKRIRSFLSMLGRARQLGSKQESCITNVLLDLYRANGFYVDDHRTWSLKYDPRPNKRYDKRQPTIGDLKRFMEFRVKQMYMGASQGATAKLEQLNKKWRSLDKQNLKGLAGHEVELGQLKGEVKELFCAYIDAIETGRELEEIIKYSSRDVIQSCYERIQNLEAVGIFKPEPPPFDERAAVWRYDLRSLNREEQVMFADVLLEEIFFEAKMRGVVEEPDTFVIIDEAHQFVSEDDDHILNIIGKEARKFGLGMILASQSLHHFPPDVVSNCATKIVLGVDEMYQVRTAQKLGVDPKKIARIIPHTSFLGQTKRKGELANRFAEVEFYKD